MFILSLTTFAQISIKGKIVSVENAPVDLAEVMLLSKDSVIIKTVLTNQDGIFKIEEKSGVYKIKVSQLGVNLYSEDLILERNIDLGIIKINANRDLGGVVIEGRKKIIERKVDRLVFNVENSISATGGDAIDVLKITPGIKVQSDKISMIGKSSMSVMVDDRLIQLSGDDLANFLKSIKTDQIKSIEVITTPPAKYDAEGNSGVVNIKLKNVKHNSWNTSLNSSYRQATYGTGSIGGSFSYQKNKLALFANANYTNGSLKGTEDENIQYPNQVWVSGYNRRVYSDILTTRFGLDYKISDRWSVGTQYLGSLSKPHTQSINQSKIYNNESLIDSIINTHSFDLKKTNINSINLHSVVKLDTSAKNVSFDLDYLNYDNAINRNFQTQNTFADLTPTQYGYKSAENLGQQKINIYSAKTDVEYPLKWIILKYGVKISSLKTKYDNKYYDTNSGNSVLNTSISNAFNYIENTQAIYISGEKGITKRWRLQLGLRAENTQTTGNSISLNQVNQNNYIEFFPTAYLMYKADDNNEFSLSYSRRLSRPRYNELNPFRVYHSPYSYTEGNPYLKPVFITNIEVQYSYKDHFISSISYAHIKNGKGNPPFFNNDTKITYLYDLNFFSSDQYSLSETYIFNKVKWWESENQADIYYTKTFFDPNLRLTNIEGCGAYLSSNNRIILNTDKTLRAEVNFWYQFPHPEDLYSVKASKNLSLGINYSLLRKSMVIGAVFNDLFKTDYQKATAVTSTPYWYSDYDDQRFLRISISYRFGNDKLNIKKRNVGNDDEKGRL